MRWDCSSCDGANRDSNPIDVLKSSEGGTFVRGVSLIADKCTTGEGSAKMPVPMVGKMAGPAGRVARETGQGLTAAAISVVVRAGGYLATFPPIGNERGSRRSEDARP